VRGPLYVADLFAGAGGMTKGFEASGFRSVAAVESDYWAARSYAANFGNQILVCPIENVAVQRQGSRLRWKGRSLEGLAMEFETPHIDVLVGGPPCQGFSPLGRMKDWSYEDPRNKLWRHYLRILRVTMPRVFLIENVPELLKSKELELLSRQAAQLGFQVIAQIVDASEHGVPQSRKRAIVIGSRIGPVKIPRATHHLATVRDAIGDLPLEPDGKNWHIARKPTEISIERYRCIPAGGNRYDLMRLRPDLTPPCWIKKTTGSTDVFGRMLWDGLAPTIRTEFQKPEKGRYLHPVADRPITVREAARLQTFPDDFIFLGSTVQAAKQIGNAIPVRLAAVLASHVKSVLAASRRSRQALTVVG
jgi:DNA (cytosine-5)-methyltransferase 1